HRGLARLGRLLALDGIAEGTGDRLELRTHLPPFSGLFFIRLRHVELFPEGRQFGHRLYDARDAQQVLMVGLEFFTGRRPWTGPVLHEVVDPVLVPRLDGAADADTAAAPRPFPREHEGDVTGIALLDDLLRLAGQIRPIQVVRQSQDGGDA